MQYRLRIETDPDPTSPREEDNLCVMACWHSRMNLGDEQISRGDKAVPKGAHVRPIFAYEHGGITLSMGPFACSFDSGQVGWIYMTREKAIECWGDELTTEKVYLAMESELSEYDDYLQGNVWGFTLEEIRTCECCETEIVKYVDSCWGFRGSYAEEGIREHLSPEALPLFEAAWENRETWVSLYS